MYVPYEYILQFIIYVILKKKNSCYKNSVKYLGII